jgi:hypothetical protein
MKDFVTALTEAVRLARLEVACYRDRACRDSAELTINRIDELLNNRSVDEAMAVFVPEEPSPSIVPEMQERKRRHLKHH